MSCAACSARVEKAVSSLEGINFCSVNLLTNSMTVEGSTSKEAIVKAVEDAGYGISDALTGEDMFKDRQTPLLIKRLCLSLGFLIVLMYISMGAMFGMPLPDILKSPLYSGILQALLSLTVLIINGRFFTSGIRSALHKAPNMDTLVALGSGASYIYSVAQLVKTAFHPHAHADFYFESAAMIVTLITVGKALEAYSKGKTTNAIRSLMALAPDEATVIREGKEIKIPVPEVKKGDIFAVKPGETIPVDGVVEEGSTSVNEAALTGESIPSDKVKGSKVSAATINISGYIRCKATEVGEDTTLAKIIKMVSNAAQSKAPIAKIADKVSAVFVPVVILIALVTAAIWFMCTGNFGESLERGVSVLVISCPCALGLATPVAVMVGSGVGAKNGIMFKTAESLEKVGETNIVVLDKTGTVTEGLPRVTDIITADDIEEETLLKYACSIEKKSEHPLAYAINEYGEKNAIEVFETEEFIALPGNGIRAIHEGQELLGGNIAFMSSKTEVQGRLLKIGTDLAEQGKTPLFFSVAGKTIGIIAVADKIKEDSQTAIRELKKMGISVVMLTGDNEKTARGIAEQAGVDKVIAEVMPEGKYTTVKELCTIGKVCMVGDGINDAPALTSADTSMAIGAGTDIAIDAADVVLMKSTLADVPAAIKLSRATLKNIKENLFWAFIYNIICIPLAAGVWIPLFSLKLNPMMGAMAMSLSSFCVVMNALRLNLKNIYKPVKGKEIIKDKKPDIEHFSYKEENNMTKTIIIEGMMCGHCEATVKKALEALSGVSSAQVSHENGRADVTLNKEVTDEELRKAVEDKEYKVISIS